MGILSTIFDKLGIGKKQGTGSSATPEKPVSTSPKPVAQTPPVQSPTIAPAPPSASMSNVSAKPAPMEMVDVVSKLDQMAKGKDLNWKNSIVDLLKVLGIDSSLENRKELAEELGCPKEYIKPDYSQMNMWLHKKVLQEIAANGGNIPKELTD